MGARKEAWSERPHLVEVYARTLLDDRHSVPFLVRVTKDVLALMSLYCAGLLQLQHSASGLGASEPESSALSTVSIMPHVLPDAQKVAVPLHCT